jgi:hypothetical protein
VGGAGLGGRCRGWDGDGDDVDGLEQGRWHGAGHTRVRSAMGSMTSTMGMMAAVGCVVGSRGGGRLKKHFERLRFRFCAAHGRERV